MIIIWQRVACGSPAGSGSISEKGVEEGPGHDAATFGLLRVLSHRSRENEV